MARASGPWNFLPKWSSAKTQFCPVEGVCTLHKGWLSGHCLQEQGTWVAARPWYPYMCLQIPVREARAWDPALSEPVNSRAELFLGDLHTLSHSVLQPFRIVFYRHIVGLRGVK